MKKSYNLKLIDKFSKSHSKVFGVLNVGKKNREEGNGRKGKKEKEGYDSRSFDTNNRTRKGG